MGDRGLPRVNRLVALRENEFRYNLHKASVRNIKCSVDNLPPPTFAHLTSKAKQKQVAIERMAKVERENLYLLEKMRRIMVEPQTDMAEPFMKGSLNREARKRDMVKIMNENEALLRRIQARAPNYDVQNWEKEHVDKEKLLSNIGEYPYRSATVSLPPRRGKLKNFGRRAIELNGKTSEEESGEDRPPHAPQTAPPGRRTYPHKNGKKGRGARAQGVAAANDRTCVFSQNNLSIRGVTSTLSVYERLNPFRLEFVALDERCLSSKNAVSIKFGDLRDRFHDDVDILKPERTDDLVAAVLPDLFFVKHGKNLQLCYKEGGPGDDDKAILADEQPPGSAAAAAAGDEIGDDSYDDESDAGGGGKKDVDTGEVSPVSITIRCKDMPFFKTNQGYIVVLYAKNEEGSKYEWVGRTEVKSGTSGQSPIFSTELFVDMYEKLDRELKFTILGVSTTKKLANKQEAKGATVVGDATVKLSQFLALPNGKLSLDVKNNGRSNGTIQLYNPQCDNPEPEEESAKKPPNSAGAKKKAAAPAKKPVPKEEKKMDSAKNEEIKSPKEKTPSAATEEAVKSPKEQQSKTPREQPLSGESASTKSLKEPPLSGKSASTKSLKGEKSASEDYTDEETDKDTTRTEENGGEMASGPPTNRSNKSLGYEEENFDEA